MIHAWKNSLIVALLLSTAGFAHAGVGDPQLRTNHPWYPGELACSTFERLFATQAALYERVTGKRVVTDHDKALASWLWRNTHYWHGMQGVEDWWGKGFGQGGDVRPREYWTGLFAHGFGLCGTTHSQWVAEMEELLGHGRGRGVGTSGHVAFEVFLKGGPYGNGRWALLDHDLSTVIFDKTSSRLLGMAEIHKKWRQLVRRNQAPNLKQGWLVCGLHPDDARSYSAYRVAEYLSGYSGPPPMVHLRRGEKLRRYFKPGLEDGKTFVFWGRNYNTAGTPGPERSHTWVNQPEMMYKSKNGAGYKPGQVRFANAVYTYQPKFSNGDYKEGVIDESDSHIVFEFYTPYIIAATPPNSKPWGIYDKGCKNGLLLQGKAHCKVSLSVDQGRTWTDCGLFQDGMDLTDHVKGHRQYLLKLHTGAANLHDSALTIRTVCQANASTMPRLKDKGTKLTFFAGSQAVVSAGPTVPQALAHVVEGNLGSPYVVMELTPPRGEAARALHAAAHVFSGSTPNPKTLYHIDYSTDEGKSWKPVAKDWNIPRRGDEPGDCWSQSFCWGSIPLKDHSAGKVRVRFHNDGKIAYARCEAHLIYQLPRTDSTRVTFAWTDNRGEHNVSHVFAGEQGHHPREASHVLSTGTNTETQWVEMSVCCPTQ